MNNSLNNYKWFQNSKYWLDDETYNKVIGNKANVPISELISKHKIIKTIRNFVDIINDEGSSKIKVVFAGQTAQTDGKTLSISSDVEDFDLLAGLSLHESSHLQYSKDHFRMLGKMKTSLTVGPKSTTDPEFVFINKAFNHFKSMGVRLDAPTQYFCLLGNFIEDARVDNKIISRYPGYEPYYDALNRKYVLSDESKERLNAETGETWKNYLSKLLLLIDKSSDLNTLKGLKEISNTIDLANINRLNGGLDVFELSFEVFKIIQKYVNQPKPQQNQNASKQTSGKSKSKSTSNTPSMPDMDNDSDNDGDEDGETSKANTNDESEDEDTNDENKGGKANEDESEDEDENDDSNNESENEDEPEEAEEPNSITEDDFEMNDGSKVMEDIINALNNEFEKEEMDANEVNAFEMITNKSVLTRTVKYKNMNVDTILIKDVTNQSLLNKFDITDLFSNRAPYSSYIENGIKKGKLLASRLSLMNDVKQIDAIRKEAGKLDQRLLPEFGHGNTKIFKTSTVGKYQDTNIHITVDSSGSMTGPSYGNALEMATMFAVASLYIKGLTVQVSVRSTIHTILGNDTPFVAIVFDSYDNHDIKHIRKYMSKLNVHDLTPEGLTFAVIKDYIIERSKTKNSLFINVSDGCPSCYCNNNHKGDGFGGDEAIEFTAKQVKDIANAGIKIISFFIHNSPDSYAGKQFVRMYGNASQFIDVVQPLKVASVFNKNIKKA